jgi:hypothetical protein
MEPAARGLETPCPVRAASAGCPRTPVLPGLFFPFGYQCASWRKRIAPIMHEPIRAADRHGEIV